MNIIYTGEKDTRLYKNVLGETISQILADDRARSISTLI